MPLSKLLLIFVAGFVLLYGLLMAPWPGWNAAYGAWFRGLGELAFTRTGEQRIVRFEPYFEQHGFSSLTTRIILGNRDLTDNAGRGPVRRLDLDTRSIDRVDHCPDPSDAVAVAAPGVGAALGDAARACFHSLFHSGLDLE
jgi:hypothetical protein